jgi:hypothetical protein
MAYTVTQLEALQAALASGELTVSYEGKTVTYRSIKDLKAAIGVVEAGLQAQGTISATPSVSYAAYSRN